MPDDFFSNFNIDLHKYNPKNWVEKEPEKGPFYIDFKEVDRQSTLRLLLWQLVELTSYEEAHDAEWRF